MKKTSIGERHRWMRYVLLQRTEFGTAVDFNRKVGMSASSINGIEMGHYNVTDTYVALLASMFGINPAWLITGDGEMFLADVPAVDTNALRRERLHTLAGKLNSVADGETEIKDEYTGIFENVVDTLIRLFQLDVTKRKR